MTSVAVHFARIGREIRGRPGDSGGVRATSLGASATGPSGRGGRHSRILGAWKTRVRVVGSDAVQCTPPPAAAALTAATLSSAAFQNPAAMQQTDLATRMTYVMQSFTTCALNAPDNAKEEARRLGHS